MPPTKNEIIAAMDAVKTRCEHVLAQLSFGHTEKIYQEALAAELRVAGWTVELERVVPISYTPSGQEHPVVVGSQRLDILAYKAGNPLLLIELKAAASLATAALRAQIRVYENALRPTYPAIIGIGVFFKQPGVKEVPLSEAIQVISSEAPSDEGVLLLDLA